MERMLELCKKWNIEMPKEVSGVLEKFDSTPMHQMNFSVGYMLNLIHDFGNFSEVINDERGKMIGYLLCLKDFGIITEKECILLRDWIIDLSFYGLI